MDEEEKRKICSDSFQKLPGLEVAFSHCLLRPTSERNERGPTKEKNGEMY
jgi:hypothetical protein